MGAAAFPADFGNPHDSHEFLKAQVFACLKRTQMNAKTGAAKTRMVQEAASEVERRASTERFSAARMRAVAESGPVPVPPAIPAIQPPAAPSHEAPAAAAKPESARRPA